MRRALLAFIATVAIVVGLLHYRTSSAPRSLRIALGSPQPGTSGSPTADPSASRVPSLSPASPASPDSGTRTITGPVETNLYGPVQVQITVSGSAITAVKTLVLPTDRARSAYISSVAGPILTQEAMQAQNANIDSVSGASFTSYSFAESLQAAITKAGL
jgi:uncharacterized protein with FMN-binding domain